MEIARFEKRIFSYIIDMILSIVTFIIINVVLARFTSISWYFVLIIAVFSSYAINLLVNVPVMGFSKGRSIGAYIFKIKTIKKDNSSIDWKIAWIKNLYLALIPIVVVNAVYMLTIHTEKTAIDKITNTVVIDIKIQ